jgi:hemoglobin
MPDDREIELPLTERAGEGRASGEGQSEDEALIRRLVDSFYGSIRRDVALGPIFEANVDDWPRHLAKMYDFWSSMVLRTGRYSGRPIQAHMKLDGLTPELFERWLLLWRETVESIAPPPARAPFINAAERMAANMRASILGT